jgi:hypothetical protein
MPDDHHPLMPRRNPEDSDLGANTRSPAPPRDAEALTLRQADQASPEGRGWPQSGQARTDFAVIESNLEFIMSQLARVPTRKHLARYSLLVMVGTAFADLGIPVSFARTSGRGKLSPRTVWWRLCLNWGWWPSLR